MSEEDIIKLIRQSLAETAKEYFKNGQRAARIDDERIDKELSEDENIHQAAIDLYAKIKRQEQNDRMPRGGRPS